jgi:phosphoglycolate phosphatase
MIESLHCSASARRARIALFDFDGTLSLIRTGWVQVMVPMMVEVLAELKTGESEEELRSLVEEYVSRLTEEQTIYQMIELARQLEKRGGKPLQTRGVQADLQPPPDAEDSRPTRRTPPGEGRT